MQDFSKLINQLRQDTEGLEHERALADAIFLGIGDGALVTDEQGNISRINKVLLRMLGYRLNEILGQWYPKTVMSVNEEGEPLDTFDRPITQALLTGKPASGRFFIRRKDGIAIPVAVTSSPILLEERPIGTIQIFKDITKEYEIDKMKSEFISIASHQLRTPLTSIITHAHMLSDGFVGQLSDEQQAFMDNIVFSAGRMHELISTLLNITRIEAGKIAVTPASTDMQKLAAEINKELMPRVSEKNQKLQVNISKVGSIETDPLLVREVMANFLSNAIKYTPDRGKINVTLTAHNGEIVYSVKDSGYGIPADQQARIFTKFFRASNVISKENIGTGLGLYMVRGIADNLGGRVWFESEENKGTTFYFALPKEGTTEKTGTSTLEATWIG